MLKIEHLYVDGFEASIRGMRNPMNSWKKSDSHWAYETDGEAVNVYYSIGEKDLELMQKLITAGPEHCKFLRQINVSFDVTAPLYWWKEADTYKIGTTANSCSTMHKIMSKPFEFDDFSKEHLYSRMGESFEGKDCLEMIIETLNHYRDLYLNGDPYDDTDNGKRKLWWWQVIQLLPSSYNQKRTITMNYAVLRNIVHQRQNHKLDEWHQFIDYIKELPYAEELIFYNNMEV